MKLSISSEKNEDTSLEDIIKQNRQKKNNLRGPQGGGINKQRNQGQQRFQGQGQRQQGGFRQQQGGFRQQRGGGPRNNDNQGNFGYKRMGMKLTITNLNFSVTDDDIKELFADFGYIESANVHYGSNGVSLGTAHVNFKNPNHAATAMQTYNGVNLDGRPMRISYKDVVAHHGHDRGGNQMQRGGNRLSGGPQRNQGNWGRQNQGNWGRQNQGNTGRQNQGNRGGRQNQGNRGGRQNQGNRGQQREKEESLTAEQLNDQLDDYLSSK